MSLKKLYYRYKFGGLKYVSCILIDIFREDKKSGKIKHEIQKKTLPSEYEKKLSEVFYFSVGRKLNIKNPQTFNEKIQWLKIYDSNSLKTQLSDKWKVREWVTKKIGDSYLIPLLGVWDSFSDIDVSKLPDSFVLKANHGSGWNVIVKDKCHENWKAIEEKFDNWLKQNFAFSIGYELHYKDIEPKIIAEQYLERLDGATEYQFWCFNGRPEFVSVIDSPHGENYKISYDMGWNELPFVTSLPRFGGMGSIVNMPKPKLFNEMKCICEKLCNDFIFVRVDLYLCEERVFFGEMTFTPASGFCKWTPKEYDQILGGKLILPMERI